MALLDTLMRRETFPVFFPPFFCLFSQKELENWYKHYQNQLNTRARELREGGAHALMENGDNSGQRPTVEDREVWEKICNMCDFQVSNWNDLYMLHFTVPILSHTFLVFFALFINFISICTTETKYRN